MSPNGNGAVIDSITRVPAFLKLAEHLKYLQIITVDNAISKLLDPVFIGWTSERKFLTSMKSVTKTYPAEKVGVLSLKDGKYNIVEYSELSPELMAAVDEQGRLQYRHGNMLVFLIEADYLVQIAQ